MNTLTLIHKFLEQKRFALVGVSRRKHDFSRQLMREFIAAGYDIVPINPHTAEVEGTRCYATVQEVQPPVPSALIMTSRIYTDRLLMDCAESGITLCNCPLTHTRCTAYANTARNSVLGLSAAQEQ